MNGDERLKRIKSRFLDCDEEDTDWQYQALAETIAIAEHYQARIAALEAQAALYKKGVLDLALEIGGCSCGPEYTGRGLISPSCSWHQASTPQILEEVGLRAEYEQLIDAALAARKGESDFDGRFHTPAKDVKGEEE